MSEPWIPKFDALADRIINQTLRLGRGERVVLMADPYVQPPLLEAVRLAVLEAGGIDHATILNRTKRLAERRDAVGRNPDPKAAADEDQAMLDLMNTAHVFIWLPGNYYQRGYTALGQSEWVLGRWRGRGVHFHWIPDLFGSPESDVSHALYRAYEHAILDLDYAALRARQQRLVEQIRGTELHVTTPDGTDMRVHLTSDGWFHMNDGDASPEKVARASCARDREEELPAGAVRTLPIADSVEGVIRYRRGQGVAGRGLDWSGFTNDLELRFRAGHLVELTAGDKTEALQTAWYAHTGDKDRVSEVVFGANPLLPVTLPGSRMPVYWAFGAGGFRFHLGDIVESGGPFQSSLSGELWFTDATVEADGRTIIDKGRLVVE